MVGSARQNMYTELARCLQQDQARLYRLAYSYSGDEQSAMDIVQTAMVKALTAKPLREPEHLRTWVYRIVVNTALDWLRAHKRYFAASDDLLDSLPSPSGSPGDPDLEQALQALPTDYQTVIVLRFFEELKLREIAEITGQNINTVKTRLYQALKLLRIEMEVGENE